MQNFLPVHSDLTLLTSLGLPLCMCSHYTSKSFNVQPYGECVESKGWSRWRTQAECQSNGGQWVMLHNYLEKAMRECRNSWKPVKMVCDFVCVCVCFHMDAKNCSGHGDLFSCATRIYLGVVISLRKITMACVCVRARVHTLFHSLSFSVSLSLSLFLSFRTHLAIPRRIYESNKSHSYSLVQWTFFFTLFSWTAECNHQSYEGAGEKEILLLVYTYAAWY